MTLQIIPQKRLLIQNMEPHFNTKTVSEATIDETELLPDGIYALIGEDGKISEIGRNKVKTERHTDYNVGEYHTSSCQVIASKKFDENGNVLEQNGQNKLHPSKEELIQFFKIAKKQFGTLPDVSDSLNQIFSTSKKTKLSKLLAQNSKILKSSRER